MKPFKILTTDFVYDKSGNMAEQRDIPDPDEPETYLATTFAYDAAGNLSVDPNDHYYEYDVYGKPYFYNESFTLLDPQKSGHNNPVMFTGQRLDTLDSGDLLLMYYKNRHYCTETGRFLQRDPIGVNDGLSIVYSFIDGVGFGQNNAKLQYIGGFNLYNYVDSKIIISVDRYGLKSDSFPNLFDYGWTPWNPYYFPRYKNPGCGTCGPDITGSLTYLTTKIQGYWDIRWDKDKRKRKCEALYNMKKIPGNPDEETIASAAWDISELFNPDKHPTCDGCPAGDPTCKHTVTVNGKCYKTWSVNYFIWGIMNRLCKSGGKAGFITPAWKAAKYKDTKDPWDHYNNPEWRGWYHEGFSYENNLNNINIGSIHEHCKPCTKKFPTNGLHFHWAPIETDDKGRVDENPKDWPPDNPDWPER